MRQAWARATWTICLSSPAPESRPPSLDARIVNRLGMRADVRGGAAA
jgi:hypothetical protein